MTNKLIKAFKSSPWLLWATVGSDIKDNDVFYFVVYRNTAIRRIEFNDLCEKVTGKQIKKFIEK